MAFYSPQEMSFQGSDHMFMGLVCTPVLISEPKSFLALSINACSRGTDPASFPPLRLLSESWLNHARYCALGSFFTFS